MAATVSLMIERFACATESVGREPNYTLEKTTFARLSNTLTAWSNVTTHRHSTTDRKWMNR